MSTLKVTNINNAAASSGGIAVDTDGHVQADGLQLPSAGPLSNRNLIVNGAMQVAQRGTSATGVNAGGYYALDRMRYSSTSLATTQSTIEQSTDAPDGFSYSLKLTVTTAEGSVNADDGFRPLNYRVEGQDLQHLQYGTSGAKSLTLSFYVKSSVTGTYSVGFYRAESTARLITGTYTINSANTWEYKTITIPGDTSASITNDNANRLEILFHAGAGTDQTSTDSSGSWGNFVLSGYAFGNTVNLQNTVNSTWQATGIQLEVGTVATPFEHRSHGQELALCQRYYQKIDFLTRNGQSSSNVDACWYQYHCPLVTEMRIGPNLVASTAYGSDTGTAIFGNTGAGDITTGLNLDNTSTNSVTVRGNTSVTRKIEGRLKLDSEL